MRIYIDMHISNRCLASEFSGGIKGKKISFLGANGVGVNALAKFCSDEGAIVCARDRVQGELLRKLESFGAEIEEENDDIEGADAVVFSSAIREDSKVLLRARDLGVKTYERHEFLSLVANAFDTVVGIAGSHGKTTVTAMLTHVLLLSDKSFVSMIGGEGFDFSNYVNNRKDGKNDVFVTEACEFRRHMLSLDIDVAVLLNQDWDHPDSYPTRKSVEEAFDEFASKAKTRVIEHGESGVRVETESESIDFEFEPALDFARVFMGGEYVGSLSAKQGLYNVKNSLFCVAAAYALGVKPQFAIKALGSLKGVKRRFEKVAEVFGKPVIFDFAHHPTELKNLFSRTKEYGDCLVVFQPHTYSRTRAYFEDYADVFSDDENGVKTLILCPTYAAREALDPACSIEALAERIVSKNAEKQVYTAKSTKSTPEFVKMMAKNYGAVLMVGAGDIYDLKADFKECSQIEE